MIYKYYYYNDNMPDTNNNTNTGQNSTDNNNQNNDSNNTQNNTSGNCVYDKYGRSPDMSVICGIGLPSAPDDEGSGFTKNVFKNKCPHCGKNTLKWGWGFGSTFEGASEGGSTEGHFFCTQADGGCDADYSAQGNEHIVGSTYKMERVSGPESSTKEEAQQLVNGQLACDGSTVSPTGNGSVVGGNAINIEDITFYGLIKQIIGGIDGIFTIANNMAYLLSFEDMYKYRQEFDEDIPIINESHIIENSLVKNWTTSGFYNSVELTYADGIIKYQNDTLVKQYGENVYYYEFPEDDEETAKAKANALLSAHIRDYSTDIELNIMYDENITEGSWVKMPKSVTKLSGRTREDRQNEKLKQQGKKIYNKRKGVNIVNLVEETIKQADNTIKKIQHITDEKGEKVDIEVDDSKYDLFFVQGYTCRWNSKNSLMMSLHLKYGPDTPQDPINASIGGMGLSSSSSAANLSGNIGQLVSQWIRNCSTDLDKAKAVHQGLMDYGIVYAYYNGFTYKTPDECLQHAQNPGLNCGDTTQLTVECMKQAGLNAYCIYRCDGAHFFTGIDIDGQTYYSDLTADEGKKSTRPWNTTWQGNTCGSKYNM